MERFVVKNKMGENFRYLTGIVLLLVAFTFILVQQTSADPVGVGVDSNTTVTGSWSPASRADDGGTFTTMVLSVTQQNYAWKAYIGNITATLTLDDSNGKTIYDWSLNQASLSGELYASRSGSLLWTGLECANGTTISSEESAVNINSGDTDSINNTFNYTKHPTLVVAGTTITNSTCRALYTYYNGSVQSNNESSYFPEIIVQNTGGDMIYVTELEQDSTSYVNDSITYDFQMLVPDDDTASQITTYYFYAEINS